MTIEYLHLTNLGPFDDIEFHFDKNVNVFLGPNNCGKSTALMALADIIVFPFNIPRKLLRDGTSKYKIRANLTPNNQKKIYSGELPIFWSSPNHKFEKREAERLSDIGFSIFIPAIRRSTDYRSKGPTVGKDVSRKDKLSEDYSLDEPLTFALWRKKSYDLSELLDPEFQKRAKFSKVGPSLVTDEAIIQTIIDLDYRSYREKKPFVRLLIEQIAQISSEITEGFPLKYIGVGEDKNGLYPEFRTPDGDLPLNVLSQGTQSILQ
ncbi:MAG: AAA family ATPase [Proteobacteria bacterium]|nr:AAA family ATPase [Pseudomonadota bacterium]